MPEPRSSATPPGEDRNPTEPARIGPYRIVELLGEGGMGTVWLAEQDEPIRRRVALKAIRTDLDSEEVRARFAAECQALALLDHPHVARVLDAGTAGHGRPYLAMEYVRGTSITAFCDAEQLDLRQRLQLFLQVCRAFAHAHECGIVHRDVKPSNVLVEMRDGAPHAKVIDFGVAKAITARLGDATPVTEVGRLIGTPEYMSPEQATGRASDARSDVYSLGVVLYELFVGELPFDGDAAREHGYLELQRRICTAEPPTPSRRLSTFDGDRQTARARLRRTSPAALRRALRGDLDRIVLRALEKRPDDRYPSARELGEDVDRHLRGEPIAGGPTLQRRARRLLQRHGRGLAAAAIGAVVALLGGLLLVERLENADLRRELGEAQDAARGAFDALPTTGGSFDLAEQEVLDGEQDRITRIRASLPHLEKTVALTARVFGDVSRQTAEATAALGRAQLAVGEAGAAAELFERVLALRRRTTPHDAQAVAAALNDLGSANLRLGRHPEAVARYRDALLLLEAAHRGDHEDVATTAHNLGEALLMAGEARESQAQLERAAAMRARLYPADHPAVVHSLSKVLDARLVRLLPAEASAAEPPESAPLEAVHAHASPAELRVTEQVQVLLLRRNERELDAAHPAVVHRRINLARTRAALGDLSGALRVHEENRRCLAEAPEDHPAVLTVGADIGVLQLRLGDTEAGRETIARVVDAIARHSAPLDARALAVRKSIARRFEAAGADAAAAHCWISVWTALAAGGDERAAHAAAEVERLLARAGEPELRALWRTVRSGAG